MLLCLIWAALSDIGTIFMPGVTSEVKTIPSDFMETYFAPRKFKPVILIFRFICQRRSVFFHFI